MQKLTQIKLARVYYVPKTLEPGVLYVSEEFGAACTFAACGCGSKVSTPLRPTEWTLEETPAGPNLTPSVGNWQLSCRSHYWIREGRIHWSVAWTPEQIVGGRHHEEVKRSPYYDALGRQRGGILQRLWRWLKSFF